MGFRKDSPGDAEGRARDTSIFSDDGDSAEQKNSNKVKLSDEDKLKNLRESVFNFIRDYNEKHPSRGEHKGKIKELNHTYKSANSNYDSIVTQLENFLFSYIKSKTGGSGVSRLFRPRMDDSELKADKHDNLPPAVQEILKKSSQAEEGHVFFNGLWNVLETVYSQDPPKKPQPQDEKSQNPPNLIEQQERRYFLYTSVSFAKECRSSLNEAKDINKLGGQVNKERAEESLHDARQVLHDAGLGSKPGRHR